MKIDQKFSGLSFVGGTLIYVGLETNTMSVNLADSHLYAANSIKSYILPSTIPELKKHCKAIIEDIFDLKVKWEKTKMVNLIGTNIFWILALHIKHNSNKHLMIKKSMRKKKIQEDEDQDGPLPSLKARPAPTLGYKAKSGNWMNL